MCVCVYIYIYIKWTNYFFDLPFPNNQNIMFRHRIIINCKTNAWKLLFLLLKGSWAQMVDELWAGQWGVYKGSERWGDRRKSRQEGNSTEEHVGYLATSGATEAEDERVQLEKRRKGKHHVLMGPIPWSSFPNVHTCLRMSHSDIKTIQILRFFQVIIFISMEIKALNLFFCLFASLSTTLRACWSRRDRRRSSGWDSSPCPSHPGLSLSPRIPGLPCSSSAVLPVGFWGPRRSELEVSIDVT